MKSHDHCQKSIQSSVSSLGNLLLEDENKQPCETQEGNMLIAPTLRGIKNRVSLRLQLDADSDVGRVNTQRVDKYKMRVFMKKRFKWRFKHITLSNSLI